MKKALMSFLFVALFAASAAAQYPYAAIVWSQPRSPTTGNVLSPATFNLVAGLFQGVRVWDHGFTDSTDYGREYMWWADLGASFSLTRPWQVVYTVDPFIARDPVTGEYWLLYSDIDVLSHGPGTGGVSGRITWQYMH